MSPVPIRTGSGAAGPVEGSVDGGVDVSPGPADGEPDDDDAADAGAEARPATVAVGEASTALEIGADGRHAPSSQATSTVAATASTRNASAGAGRRRPIEGVAPSEA